jgi:hypothetical protein
MNSPLHTPRSIDASLARSIRRGYFRRLAHEWEAAARRRQRAARRNVLLSAGIDNRRQFRQRLGLLEKLVGPLLPACTLRIESGTRAAAVVWALRPQEVPTPVQIVSNADVRALVLLQPGRALTLDAPVRVRAHAVDRVVQRARVVALPVTDADMQAVNAEFSDLLPLACVAARTMRDFAGTAGAAAAGQVSVLLPAQHGVFLGRWAAEAGLLEVHTFVDSARLVQAQLDAVREIEHIAQAHVCAEALAALVPGWMGADDGTLRAQLLKAWQHLGWRFAEEGLHPGLSDRAWKSREEADASPGLAWAGGGRPPQALHSPAAACC